MLLPIYMLVKEVVNILFTQKDVTFNTETIDILKKYQNCIREIRLQGMVESLQTFIHTFYENHYEFAKLLWKLQISHFDDSIVKHTKMLEMFLLIYMFRVYLTRVRLGDSLRQLLFPSIFHPYHCPSSFFSPSFPLTRFQRVQETFLRFYY